MKKLGICLVLILVVVGTPCFAQSNNDAQRIVGTWVKTEPSITYTYTFNPNGTFTYTDSRSNDYNRNGRYFVSNGKLIVRVEDGYTYIMDYYCSSDGKVLFLEKAFSSGWFDKK